MCLAKIDCSFLLFADITVSQFSQGFKTVCGVKTSPQPNEALKLLTTKEKYNTAAPENIF